MFVIFFLGGGAYVDYRYRVGPSIEPSVAGGQSKTRFVVLLQPNKSNAGPSSSQPSSSSPRKTRKQRQKQQQQQQRQTNEAADGSEAAEEAEEGDEEEQDEILRLLMLEPQRGVRRRVDQVMNA